MFPVPPIPVPPFPPSIGFPPGGPVLGPGRPPIVARPPAGGPIGVGNSAPPPLANPVSVGDLLNKLLSAGIIGESAQKEQEKKPEVPRLTFKHTDQLKVLVFSAIFRRWRFGSASSCIVRVNSA